MEVDAIQDTVSVGCCTSCSGWRWGHWMDRWSTGREPKRPSPRRGILWCRRAYCAGCYGDYRVVECWIVLVLGLRKKEEDEENRAWREIARDSGLPLMANGFLLSVATQFWYTLAKAQSRLSLLEGYWTGCAR